VNFFRAVGVLAVIAGGLGAPAVHAQTSSGGCVVERAAQAALDRQVKRIEAAQTDVSSFFQGQNSCINQNLLNIIDFSRFIPDLSSLVSQIGQDAVNKLLNQAVQKACDIANDQIGDVTNKMNTSLVDWDQGLDDEVRSIISGGQVSLGKGSL
jgi:hypothetical protein